MKIAKPLHPLKNFGDFGGFLLGRMETVAAGYRVIGRSIEYFNLRGVIRHVLGDGRHVSYDVIFDNGEEVLLKRKDFWIDAGESTSEDDGERTVETRTSSSLSMDSSGIEELFSSLVSPDS